MTAQELRIGNLATIDNPKNWPNLKDVPMIITGVSKIYDPIKLSMFPKSTFSVSFEDKEGNSYSQMDQFVKPIPLTEEWMLKAGFEITYSSNFRLKFDHPKHGFIGYDFSRVSDKSMEGFRYYGHYIKISFVHQLQNLYFSLTGEELGFSH